MMQTDPDDLQYDEVAPDDEQCVLNAALACNWPPAKVPCVPQSPSPEARHGLYCDGRLVTQCVLLPLRIAHGGGGTVAAGGIDAVATPPEERRRGYVARLLREVCDELRSQCTPRSMLSAFNGSSYWRYSWVMFHEARRFSGALALFAPFRA